MAIVRVAIHNEMGITDDQIRGEMAAEGVSVDAACDRLIAQLRSALMAGDCMSEVTPQNMLPSRLRERGSTRASEHRRKKTERKYASERAQEKKNEKNEQAHLKRRRNSRRHRGGCRGGGGGGEGGMFLSSTLLSTSRSCKSLCIQYTMYVMGGDRG